MPDPILSLLEELSAAYRDRDADRYLACFAEHAYVYGTGSDEQCRGSNEIRAHVERDWAQSSSASFTLLDPHIVVSGPNAWVAADCSFAFHTEAGACSAAGRVSLVLVQANGEWLVQHAHFSLPAPTAEGESF